MRLFLSRRHLVYISAAAALLAAGLVLCGCQDVVRRLDDKYRPVVPEPVRSVTIVTDSIDSNGVPVRLVNLEVEDLELVAKDAGSGEVPFTPTLEADEQHDGLAYIRTPPNGKPIKDFSVTVSLCSKADGTEYASHTFTADRYPYRHYEVNGKPYKFELVKMFHFEQNRGNFGPVVGGGDGIVCLFTGNNDESQDVNEKGSTVTISDTNTDSQKGTGLTFYYNTSDAGQFKENQYDYVEIKFRSGEGQSPEFALLGEGTTTSRFGFWYDGGHIGAGEGITVSGFRVSDFSALALSHNSSSIDLTYDDSDNDWCVIGFHNGKDSKCLFTENLEDAIEKTLVSTKDFDYTRTYTVLYVGSGAILEIDYIAFFKKVE